MPCSYPACSKFCIHLEFLPEIVCKVGKVYKVEKVRSTFHTFHDYLNFCGEKKDDRLFTIYRKREWNMFYYLYKRYKVDILQKDSTFSFKDMQLYEKIFLAMWIIGAMLLLAFALLEYMIGIFGSSAILFIAFLILIIGGSNKMEQRRILNEKIGPAAEKRMNDMVKLLRSFHIDVHNKKQLEEIIVMARKEEELYDIWKGFRGLFKGMTTYILLPVISILLAEYFRDVAWPTLITRAIVLMLFCLSMVLMIFVFSMGITDILNPEIKDLRRLIRDIEDIKVFFRDRDISFSSLKNEI